MADLLDMDYINSLPQPLWDDGWPVYDIEVSTGLYRIDVCGLLEVRHMDRCLTMKDAIGKTHYTGDFYTDPEMWEDRFHAIQQVSTQAGEATIGKSS